MRDSVIVVKPFGVGCSARPLGIIGRVGPNGRIAQNGTTRMGHRTMSSRVIGRVRHERERRSRVGDSFQ